MIHTHLHTNTHTYTHTHNNKYMTPETKKHVIVKLLPLIKNQMLPTGISADVMNSSIYFVSSLLRTMTRISKLKTDFTPELFFKIFKKK